MIDPNSTIWSVNRLKSHFRDSLGNPLTTQGTGFWLVLDSYCREFGFVTNRHNLDPELKVNRDGSDYQLEKLEIELRSRTPVSDDPSSFSIDKETEFFELASQFKESIYYSDTADVAFLYPLKFNSLGSQFEPYSTFRVDDLADDYFFNFRVSVMDYCHFIGFASAGDRKPGWWDHGANAPIARLASLASNPHTYFEFSHPEITMTDVILVSGLSFSGASGSPVILDQKGLGTDVPALEFESKFIRNPSRSNEKEQSEHSRERGPYFVDENFVPRKILGVMTGHCNNEIQQRLEHSGLSYFTRATALFPLLERAGFTREVETGWWRKSQITNGCS